jgi:hypothetical protein
MRQSIKSFRARFRRWQEALREPGLTALLLIEGVLIFFVTPLVGIGLVPGFVSAAMFILLVLAILMVTSRSHGAAALVLIAVLLSPAGVFAHAEDPSVLTEWLSAGGRLLAIAAVTFVIAKAVFGSGRVTWHRIQGAVVLYLNCALFFFTIYRLLDVLAPNSFNGLPATSAEHGSGAALLYFSFSTLTTLGFGDIAPVHPMARSLANLEAVLGQLYPATLLARLVTLEIEHRRQAKGSRSAD